MGANVLARDLRSYQTAVDRYRQQAGRYNRQVSNYNDSLVTDADGNVYARTADGNVYRIDPNTGRVNSGQLPQGKTLGDYGSTPIEGNNSYFLLRQNPTTAGTTDYKDVRLNVDENGTQSYYQRVPTNDVESPYQDQYLPGSPSQYKVVAQRQVQISTDAETGQPIYQTVYDLSTDNSIYPDKPTEFTAKAPTNKPDPTLSQLRALQGGSLADYERGGLITDTIGRQSIY